VPPTRFSNYDSANTPVKASQPIPVQHLVGLTQRRIMKTLHFTRQDAPKRRFLTNEHATYREVLRVKCALHYTNKDQKEKHPLYAPTPPPPKKKNLSLVRTVGASNSSISRMAKCAFSLTEYAEH
jgi:hypothetical protein